jgi:predicted aldo/keto reductase-like oxidoreductase
MRLPMKSGGEVDREKAIPMLHHAVEKGITYFDTAVGYCGGDSQRVLGEAMEAMRDKVILSTKNHHYRKEDKAGWWKNLEDSLERLRTDCIDIYNFHGMNFERYQQSIDGDDGLYKEMLKAKEQGLIRHICHSFHGGVESMKKCVDTGLFESVTVQYNLLNREMEEGIAYAAEHGMGVVIMGPVAGGRLGYPSERAAELVGKVRSTPELALRFVLSNPNVSLALSGMSTMEQLKENIETVSSLGELSTQDHEQIEAAIQERKKLSGLYCTGCGYCMPCPEGVDIPANFEILNLERVFGLTDHARARYSSLAGKAALCRLCGKCVEPCPQELDIPARLTEAVAVLDERAGDVAGWAELRGASLDEQDMIKIDMGYHLKNFTDEAQDVQVTMSPHREEQVTPAEFEVQNLRAYGRRDRDLAVLVRQPLEGLSLDVVLKSNGKTAVQHLHYVVAAAMGVNGEARDAHSWRGGVCHVPSPIHPAHSWEGGLQGHSFDFGVAHDDDHLYVRVDVTDDLLHLAPADYNWRGNADSLRIFLDGRSPERIGEGGYQKGVTVLTICPQGADAEPLVRAPEDAEVEVDFERTELGYCVDCAIPWAAFSVVEGKPGVIGFDVAIDSYDAEGKEQIALAWTGRSGQRRNPGAFGRLLIV